MIEPIMYFGIGFLVSALLGLLFVPLVHNRAVRTPSATLIGQGRDTTRIFLT
jgi:hypothetical protein